MMMMMLMFPLQDLSHLLSHQKIRFDKIIFKNIREYLK